MSTRREQQISVALRATVGGLGRGLGILARAALNGRDNASRFRRERDEARANYQFMVDRAADEKLDGYRELGARAANAENERDAAIARAERAERLCVALVDTLGHSCALPDGRTMFAASCHYMQSDWREQVEAMRAMVKP